jgi:hypothetical protein
MLNTFSLFILYFFIFKSLIMKIFESNLLVVANNFLINSFNIGFSNVPTNF